MFAKVFSSILDSSIADDWQMRVVFTDLLVLADKDGVVDMTAESIARRTNVPLDIVKDRLAKLELPDPSSRTPDCEGRRITRLDPHRDWGWRITNFVKYRESATKEMLRMSDAERKREYRSRFGRAPSPAPPTPQKETQRKRENSPGSVSDLSGTVRDMSETPPLRFEQLGPKLFRWELEGMKKDAQAELKRIKANLDNYCKDITPAALDLIAFLEREKPEKWEQRITEAKANPDSYERTTLKPLAGADVETCKRRIEDINRRMAGIVN